MEQEERAWLIYYTWTAECDGNAKRQYDCNKLLDAQQLDLEDKVGIWRNSRRPALGSIGEITRNKQLAFAAHFHGLQPFVPPLDYPAEPEFDGFPAGHVVRVIELSAVLQPANVMDRYRLPHLRAWSVADSEILNL